MVALSPAAVQKLFPDMSIVEATSRIGLTFMLVFVKHTPKTETVVIYNGHQLFSKTSRAAGGRSVRETDAFEQVWAEMSFGKNLYNPNAASWRRGLEYAGWDLRDVVQ